MHHICIIAEGYPYEGKPIFTFVRQLSEAFADKKIKVSVIAPQSVSKSLLHSVPLVPKFRDEVTRRGNKVSVYSPYIFTIGNSNIFNINARSFGLAVCNIIEKMSIKPDVIYGHFWSSAYAAYPVAKKFNIPLFVATGESKITIHHKYSLKELASFVNYIKGVICVSTKNMNESINAGLTTAQKCIVIPNAIDNNSFKLLDKITCRKKLGLPLEVFIVISVGWFSERKGTKRVSSAINKVQDGNIYSIFIGSGSEEPNCENILYKGRVSHDLIPLYLNASDVFVLPTLHEGCCNAVVEAMACGLPIISSDREFNYDLLNNNNSILVDPLNIQKIAEGIQNIYHNPQLREKLSKHSLSIASGLNIDNRADSIISFIEFKR